jgi:hypothetical protein
MEPVEGWNLNCRYISGLEPELPVHIRTWTWITGTYQDLNPNRRYISGLEPESPVHIRTWTWIAGNNIILMAFQLQQWFHERASILRYTYVASVLSIAVCATDIDRICSVLRKTMTRTFNHQVAPTYRHFHLWDFHLNPQRHLSISDSLCVR